MKIGFIGAGNMAGAIIAAISKANAANPEDVYIFDTAEEKIIEYSKRGYSVCRSSSEIADSCKVIVLAVKPQNMSEVLNDIVGHTQDKCILSIAAGVTINSIKAKLGKSTSVVRVLPNTPMLMLCGATVIAEPDENVSDEIFSFICSVFRAAGEVSVLPESMINAAIPVSSSSPAFFFRMVQAMAQVATEHGIHRETATRLAATTMLGSAHMLLDSGKTPDELIRQVSSPNGTTVAALTAFDEFNYENLIRSAFNRCVTRAEELGSEK